MKELAMICIVAEVISLSGTTPVVASQVTIRIDIEAMIDGRDLLIIRGNTLQWHHLGWAAVGRYGGLNEPTIISTKIDDVVQMDRVNWFPEWPEEPPAEIRYEAFSSVFTELVPSLPATDMIIDVTWMPLQARGMTSLEKILNEDNSYTLFVEFYDNPSAYAWYKGQIKIDVIPEPCTVLLLGLGGFALLRKRRL